MTGQFEMVPQFKASTEQARAALSTQNAMKRERNKAIFEQLRQKYSNDPLMQQYDPKYERYYDPYRGYKAAETELLTDLVGQKNVGLKFTPEFNSANAARKWIVNKRNKAKDEKEQQYWSRWDVAEMDLDADPYTPNNVIVYSDKDARKIKSVDGYQIIPRTKKEALRAKYDAIPNKEVRSALARSEQARRLQAYFKKYKTLADWNEHPIEDFNLEDHISAFNMLREQVKEVLEYYGFRAKETDQHPKTLTVTHYMTILQKLTSALMKRFYTEFLGYIPKGKKAQKIVKEILNDSASNYPDKLPNADPDNIVILEFIEKHREALFNGDNGYIITLCNIINDQRDGPKVIVLGTIPNPDATRPDIKVIYNVKDLDLTKQKSEKLVFTDEMLANYPISKHYNFEELGFEPRQVRVKQPSTKPKRGPSQSSSQTRLRKLATRVSGSKQLEKEPDE
jgi:hypothetical protein